MQGIKKVVNFSLEIIVLALMASQVVVVVMGVAYRYTGHSLVWYDEVAAVLLAWLTYFGAALAALHRGHIGFPGIIMKPFLKTVRLPIYIAGELLVIGFFIIVFWYGCVVLGVLTDEYLVSLPFIPSVLVQSIVPIGAVLFIAGQVLSVKDGWRRISPQ